MMKETRIELVASELARLISGSPPSGKNVDPETLVDLACHHDLDALGSHLAGKSAAWRKFLDGKPLARLDQQVLKAKIRHRMVNDSLHDAIDLLSELRPLLFKGLALSELYPSPYHRNPGDIDLIVEEDAFGDATKILETNGWRLQPTVHRDRLNEVADEYGFAKVFRHPDRPVILDLHRAPIDKTEAFWIEPEDLFNHSIQVKLNNEFSISTPGNEEHLAMIALHSIRHGTFRIGWCLDVHLACMAWQASIDSARFENFCDRWKIKKAVLVAFEVSRRMFDTNWHPLQHIPLDYFTMAAINRRTPGVIAHGHLVQRGAWRRVSAMVDIMDNMSLKSKYLLHTMFPPKRLYTTEKIKDFSTLSYIKRRLIKLKDFMGLLIKPKGSKR